MAVTVDEEQVFHMLSDAQLTIIESHGRGPFFDLALFFGGIAFALIKDFLSTAGKIYSKTPVEASDGIPAFIFVAAAAAGIAFYLAARSSRETVSTICKQIRERRAQRGQPSAG
jgi:hypothetical protein